MIKKRLISLILLVSLMLSPIVVLASDISDAQYYGIIQVSNNSTATTNVATTCNISTQNLIDGDYLNASANNCVIRTSSGGDVVFQPSVNASYLWSIWEESIGANTYDTDILYTANSTGGLIAYFPGAAGMATADNDATLEPADNFTIEQSGWVNTDAGADKDLVDKTGAMSVFVSPLVSENITAATTSRIAINLIPNAAGTHCLITGETGVACPNHYQNVDEAEGAPNDADFVTETNTSFYMDSYNVDNVTATVNSTARIRSVAVYFRLLGAGAANMEARPGLLLNGNYTVGTIVEHTGGAWANYNEALARPGGGNWQVSDLNDLEVVIELRKSGANDAQCSQVFIKVIYDELLATATATGVASDNHTITVTTDNNSLYLGIGKDIAEADFPASDNLVLNAPLWHNELRSSPFTTKDVNEHTCTVTGATWTTSGYSFDGGDLIDCGNDATLNPGSSNFTIIVWATKTSAGAGGLLDKDNVGNYNIYFPNNASVRLELVDDSLNSVSSPFAFDSSAGTFNQYTLVVNRTTNIAQMYANAIQLGADIGIAPLVDEINPLNSLQLGTYATSWEGLIGEVQMYNIAYTQPQIEANYDATKWKYETPTSDEFFHYNLMPAGGVPDTTANWTFCENDSFMWLTSQIITIGGVERQRIAWEYDTTFTDGSGNGNDAVPSFRTASSDADVSATLLSFNPVSEAKAPEYVLDEVTPFIDADYLTDNLTPAGGFTTTANTSSGFPLAGAIASVASATATPAQLPLVTLAMFVILIVSFCTGYMLKKYGRGSLLVKMLVTCVMMGIFVALKNFGWDMWMIYLYVIIAVALGFGSKAISI